MRRLVRLAYNFRWTWEPRAASVFEDLGPEIWQTSHNPVATLRALEAADIERIGDHAGAIDAAADDLDRYLDARPTTILPSFPRVAYFSAEFAIAECLPIYSGGLGVLAGDHLKTASDLGLPIVGVGLLYQYGYFRQGLDDAGRQTETYERVYPSQLPLRQVRVGERLPCRICIPFAHGPVYVRAWRAEVGRTRLYLLDTNLPENAEEDRLITGHLYGGDDDTRLRQEIVLGIGGARLMRALNAAGIEPLADTFHLNEGHSAMLVLELARQRLEAEYGTSFEDALEHVASDVAFTTHTAEIAGHDAFASTLIERHLCEYRRELRLSHSQLMRLGRLNPADDREPFSMTVLAMHGASRRNAVSEIHARVSRDAWHAVGIGLRNRSPQIMMEAITNGVHAPSWVGPDMAGLFDGWLGRGWRLSSRVPRVWSALEDVPLWMLWQARTHQRARLIAHVQLDVDPADVLVVGFARRFATYKRAGLLLEDAPRLAQLLTGNPRQPVVIMFAGKAHPRDEPGKRLVQQVVEASRDPRFGGHILFIPDYGLDTARLLVQGADVWLNTPRRPHEACGTSGMKAVLNGAVHVSEHDGWWEDAYRPGVGWALGTGVPADLSDEERDRAEARQLMDILEHEAVPMFAERETAGFPRRWLELVVRSIVGLAPLCTAERMLVDYATRVYVGAPTQRPECASVDPISTGCARREYAP